MVDPFHIDHIRSNCALDTLEVLQSQPHDLDITNGHDAHGESCMPTSWTSKILRETDKIIVGFEVAPIIQRAHAQGSGSVLRCRLR